MSLTLLPAPRTHMTHASILANAIKAWMDEQYRKEHPVTRIVFASETVTTTTRTVIAVERKA